MRKGLKRSGLLLIAIGILALAYHFGNQTGSSIPYEPTPYQPEDLAPPTPIVEECQATSSQPIVVEAKESKPTNSPQTQSSISRRVKIISVEAAKCAPIQLAPQASVEAPKSTPIQLAPQAVVVRPILEMRRGEVGKPKAVVVQPILEMRSKEDGMMKNERVINQSPDSSPILHPSLGETPVKPVSQPEPVAPAPIATRRRPMEDEDVAWHAIENTAGKSKSGPVAGARFFPEPGTTTQGPTDEVPPRELAKSLTSSGISTPVDSTTHKDPGPEIAKAVAALNQPQKTTSSLSGVEQPARKNVPPESISNSVAPDSGRMANTHTPKAEESATPVTPAINKPTAATPIKAAEPQPNSKMKSSYPIVPGPMSPPAPLPSGTKSSALTTSSTVARITQTKPAEAKVAESSAVTRLPDHVNQASEKPQAGPVKSRPKVRIVGLYPVVTEVKSSAPAAQTIKQVVSPKVATPPAPVAQKAPVSLSVNLPKVVGSELAPLQKTPKSKIIDLSATPSESKPISSPAKPAIQGIVAASGTLPATPSVQRAVHHEFQTAPEKTKAASADPGPRGDRLQPATPSEGVVFMPPAELPGSVTGAASELATQKLIARSMSDPSGVAARLTHAKLSSSGADGSELILAGARIDYDASSEEEGRPKSYSTTGVLQLKASKEEIAAGAHLDYVTNGVVILGDPELSDPRLGDSQKSDLQYPTINSSISIRQKTIRNAIQAACGNKIKDLEVMLDSAQTRVHISLKASKSDEGQLRQAILSLTELAEFKIQLKIEAVP